MSEMNDYSGEFKSDLAFKDFSPEFLERLLQLYGKLYIAIDGFWYLGVKEHVDNETALKVDLWAWDKSTRYELKKLTALAGIQGDGIDALFKLLQIVPWMQITEHKTEMESPKKGLLTVTRCATLEALEREGLGREKEICSTVDAAVFRSYAAFFNPNIKVEPLAIPPRADRDGICCQWEFTLS